MPGLARRVQMLRRSRADHLSVYGLLLLEVAAIVLAIVLGLMVNEWREGRVRAQTADAALRSIAAEMRYNHAQVAGSYAYYRTILEQLEAEAARQQALPEADRAPLLAHRMPGWRGAMPPMLRDSSFRALVATGTMRDLPFDTAETLSLIYNFQSLNHDFERDWIAQAAASRDFVRGENVAHRFGLAVEMLPSLIGMYQKLGRPLLATHGYDLDIDDPQLREVAMRQVAHMQSSTGSGGKPVAPPAH